MADSAAGRIMPIIAVPSVDATRDFYVETLGFQHVMGMVGKDGLLDFCTVVLGGASIMFNRAPASQAPATRQPVDIYLEVADVEALHATLKARGVAISDPLTLQWWGDRTFKVRDPNGYEIWFYTNVSEPVPPSGATFV